MYISNKNILKFKKIVKFRDIFSKNLFTCYLLSMYLDSSRGRSRKIDHPSSYLPIIFYLLGSNDSK